jgi:DNA-binding NtrC family response regulator
VAGEGRETKAPSAPRGRILVVEDDEALSRLVVRVLAAEGYEASAVRSAAEALEALSGHLLDIVLLDIRLPDGDGVEVLRRIKERDAGVEVVILTGYPDVASAVEALKAGAFDYLSKPVDLAVLVRTVSQILERSRLRDEVRSLRSRLGERLAARELVASSAAMREVKATLVAVAPTASTVLIEGETGTGKEVVAAAIHRLSPRRDRPFLPINCGAIPADLLESELFGHVRGAFSGAVSDTPGLFRAAEGGTVFLDEVAELPQQLQVKLLRVLQERAVRPVGSTRSFPFDCRLVAATNQPLEEAVRAGLVRSDLYYRLNVVKVVLPPLRERREDISALVAHFLRDLNDRFGRRVRGVSPEAMALLLAYDFPGNVRELEHLLERAFALGARDEIGPSDLPDLCSRRPEGDENPLERAERETILETLRRTGGDKDAAARELGMSRRTLYRRLRDFSPGSRR